MLIKRSGIAVILALCCWGCKDGSNEQPVRELLSRQKENAESISQMSKKIEAADEKLSAIERRINALLAGGGAAEPTEKRQVFVSSNFASTKEYQDVLRQIALLQEQVVSVQGEVTGFRTEEAGSGEREALRDRGAAWRALSDPQELSRRLDILANNFSGRIADPTTKQQFLADMEEMKKRYSAALSPEQKAEEARAMVSRALEGMPDDRRREFVERQLRSLDEADSADQLAEQVDRIIQFQRMREIGDLGRKYNIPEEVIRDSGLVSFGREGPPGFGPRMGR